MKKIYNLFSIQSYYSPRVTYSLSLTYLDLRDLAGEGAVRGGAGEEDDDELPEEQEEVHLKRDCQYNDSNL